MRSTTFRYRHHHHVNGREKCPCILLISTLIVILLVNTYILASAEQRSTLAILTQVPSRYQSSTYQNIRLGFKLVHPNSWKIISEIIRNNNNYSNVLFVTPENQFPNLRSLFSITAEKFDLCKQNDNSITSKYCTQTVIKMQNTRNIQMVNDLRRNPYVIDYSTINTTLSGFPAKQITLKTSALGGLQKLEISTAHNDRLYTLTYVAKPEIFQKNIKDIAATIASFRIYQ
ncbi:MAG TPA: hypothetical protein VH500_01050 [Nitrososphaeraceae archaeon]